MLSVYRSRAPLPGSADVDPRIPQGRPDLTRVRRYDERHVPPNLIV